MNIDVRNIGIFGLSFSRGFDQTWFNLWRKEDGYSMDLFQNVESDDEDDDEEIIDTKVMISFEEGERILQSILDDGHVGKWAGNYNDVRDAEDSELTWTLDIDDLDEEDLFFSSGNGKMPQREWMMGVLDAIRTGEPGFGLCFKELR
jgi:hypothetical protein